MTVTVDKILRVCCIKKKPAHNAQAKVVSLPHFTANCPQVVCGLLLLGWCEAMTKY